MLSQNKNKSYLVSVEKAVKQSKGVAECGNAALHNISQIVKFLKIEKMHSLVFETENPTDLKTFEETSFYKMNEENNEKEGQPATIAANMSSKDKHTSRASEEEQHDVNYAVDKTQAMLDSLKQQIDLPVNFKPKTIENPKAKL